MSFDSAIPVNRIAYGRNDSFDQGSRGRGAYGSKDESSWSRQSVNISQDTLLKVARAKLNRMVDQKRAYGPQGVIAMPQPVGSLFSAKA